MQKARPWQEDFIWLLNILVDRILVKRSLMLRVASTGTMDRVRSLYALQVVVVSNEIYLTRVKL